MKDDLPHKINKYKECGIINLDNSVGPGTHWTAYIKNRQHILYFDSFGNLKPAINVVRYFNSSTIPTIIEYNYGNFQNYNTFNCGHLCLEFLYKYSVEN